MNEKKEKIITHVGMWLAAIVGSLFGLVFSIIGYLLGEGPGGSMEGPLWRVLLVGIPSVLLAAYAGELLVRKLAKRMLSKHSSVSKNTVMAFVMVFIGCIVAIAVGFEIVYAMGKITGAIEGLEWNVLLYVPLGAILYGFLPSLGAGVLYSLFVFIYLKRR
jgi:hypothetical protein